MPLKKAPVTSRDREACQAAFPLKCSPQGCALTESLCNLVTVEFEIGITACIIGGSLVGYQIRYIVAGVLVDNFTPISPIMQINNNFKEFEINSKFKGLETARILKKTSKFG